MILMNYITYLANEDHRVEIDSSNINGFISNEEIINLTVYIRGTDRVVSMPLEVSKIYNKDYVNEKIERFGRIINRDKFKYYSDSKQNEGIN